MNQPLGADLATEILAAVDGFSQPCDRLGEALRRIQDEDLRKALLRQLGEIMAILEADIGQPIRKEISAFR